MLLFFGGWGVCDDLSDFLDTLDIGGNQLTGTFPQDIGEIAELGKFATK